MIYTGLGLRRRTAHARDRLLATRPYHAAGILLPVVTVFQPIFRVHSQRRKGSCVGQALTSGAERILRVALSAVDLWVDARRRQGDLPDWNTGTDSEHAIESALIRGFSRYVDGEDSRPVTEDIQIPSLEQELSAADRRIAVDAEHRSINALSTTAVQEFVDALQRGYAVIFGTGVYDRYFDLGVNDLADGGCLGADSQGHEQAILAYIAPNDTRFPISDRGKFIIQNSWGPEWGGYVLPCQVTCTDGSVLNAGTVLYGCVLATEDVVTRTAWDADALEIRIAA